MYVLYIICKYMYICIYSEMTYDLTLGMLYIYMYIYVYIYIVNVPSSCNINLLHLIAHDMNPMLLPLGANLLPTAPLWTVQLGGREDSFRPVKQGFAAWLEDRVPRIISGR